MDAFVIYLGLCIVSYNLALIKDELKRMNDNKE